MTVTEAAPAAPSPQEPASTGLFGFLADFQSGAARAEDPDAATGDRTTEEER